MALVGGGQKPKYPLNKVIIWDELQEKIICEIKLSFLIKNVKLNPFFLFVLTDSKIFVFTLKNFNNVEVIDTFENPRGIFSLSYYENITRISYPSTQRSNISIKTYEKETIGNENSFWVHSSLIGALSLNSDGSLIATASENGTLIRIYKASTGEIGLEFRRGSDKAGISSLHFDLESEFLSCTSDKNTIHIFALRNREDLKDCRGDDSVGSEKSEGKKRNEISFRKVQMHEGVFGSLTKYFGTSGKPKPKRSFSQFKLPDINGVCTFDPKEGNPIVITEGGKLFKLKFDRNNGGNISGNYEIFNILTK